MTSPYTTAKAGGLKGALLLCRACGGTVHQRQVLGDLHREQAATPPYAEALRNLGLQLHSYMWVSRGYEDGGEEIRNPLQSVQTETQPRRRQKGAQLADGSWLPKLSAWGRRMTKSRQGEQASRLEC